MTSRLRDLGSNLLIIALTTALAIVAVAVFAYYRLYEDFTADYMRAVRSIVQVTCGRVVDDARIYTLMPGECFFASSEFDTRVSVDNEGYRRVSAPPSPGGARVVLTGDSHAMGWGVTDGADMASRIGAAGGFQVRSLAMSSYGTARELLTLDKFRPQADAIIIPYCENDYRENKAFNNNPAAFIADYGARAKKFASWVKQIKDQNEKDRLQRAVTKRFYAALIGIWRSIGLPPRPIGSVNEKSLAAEANAFAAVLRHFSKLLEGKRIIVFESNAWGNSRPRFVELFSSAAGKAGLADITFLDTRKLLGRSDYYYFDDHLTATGHRKLATQIVSLIGNQPASGRR